MTAIQHVFKRGSIYWWRRRLPIGTEHCDWVRLELSLDTKELERAKRIAPEVTLASHHLQPVLKNKMIPADIARQILIKVARDHSDRLDAVDARGRSSNPEQARRSSTASGWAYSLLAAQGRGAVVGPAEQLDLHNAGLDDALIEQVKSTLKFYQDNQFAVVGQKQLTELLREFNLPPSAADLRYAETLYLRGHAAALLNTERRYSGVRIDDLALVQEALKMPATQSVEVTKSVESTTSLSLIPHDPWEPPVKVSSTAITSPKPTPDPVVTHLEQPHYSDEPELEDEEDLDFNDAADVVSAPGALAEVTPSLSEIVAQAAKEKVKLNDWGEDMVKQHVSVARLLVRFLGHDQPRAIRQVDISGFRSLLFKLPKNHGKSPKDHTLPIADLISRAESLPPEKVGMAMSTINRYMTQLNNIADICKHAGYPFQDYAGVSGLRARKKSDPRSERGRFSTEELKEIFKLPVWTGAVSEEQRLDPGQMVVHDSTYWVPLMSIYNGARREENCGLLLDEIDDQDEFPCFVFQINRLRGLKNPQSKRRVPIHSELIRLGFLDYVKELRNSGHELLFPELLPSNSVTPMGDVFDDSWQKMRAAALPKAKEERKVLHSLRHWCNNEMKQNLVFAEIRRDIMGHTTGDVNEGRYSDPARLKVTSDALSTLPLPTADVRPYPIKLIKQVVDHTPRASRRRKASRA